MKKLFILAAAIIALASCQKEQASYVEDGSIKFATAQTRATLVSDLDKLEKGGFTVLGYAKDAIIFDNETAQPKGTNTWWEMTTKRYWADNTTYNFFAVYPTVNKENGFVVADENKTSATINFANTGEIDLILAGTQIKTKEGVEGAGRTTAAHMTFKHALSRVAFKFVNAYKSAAGTPIYLKVEGLKLMSEKGSGTAKITSVVDENTTDKKSSSEITWSSINKSGDIEYMVKGEFANSEKIYQVGNTENNPTYALTDYKYIFPTTDLTNGVAAYKIACVITAYDDKENTIRVFDFSEGIDVKTTTTELNHVAGQSYTYTMTIKEDLNEIKFDVDVEDWIINEEQEIEFPNK